MAKRALGCFVEKSRAVARNGATEEGSSIVGGIEIVGIWARRSMKRSAVLRCDS